MFTHEIFFVYFSGNLGIDCQIRSRDDVSYFPPSEVMNGEPFTDLERYLHTVWRTRVYYRLFVLTPVFEKTKTQEKTQALGEVFQKLKNIKKITQI